MDTGVSVRRSDSIAALSAAMCKAQAELKNPPKDSAPMTKPCRYPLIAKTSMSRIRIPSTTSTRSE